MIKDQLKKTKNKKPLIYPQHRNSLIVFLAILRLYTTYDLSMKQVIKF